MSAAHYVYDASGNCWSSHFPMTAPRITAKDFSPRESWFTRLLHLFAV